MTNIKPSCEGFNDWLQMMTLLHPHSSKYCFPLDMPSLKLQIFYWMEFLLILSQSKDGDIVLCDKMKYLRVMIVYDKLSFNTHVQLVVSLSSQCMYIVMIFNFFSSKPLPKLVFRSFWCVFQYSFPAHTFYLFTF